MTIDGNEKVVALVKELNEKVNSFVNRTDLKSGLGAVLVNWYR